MKFAELVNEISGIGLQWHRDTILRNTTENSEGIEKTIREIEPDARAALIVSAGPSLYRQNILKRIWGRFLGNVIATDGAYIQCLKAGIVPDYVITLDPHPTRMVRWFGDPDFAKNSEGDDYFERQDLDIAFRENAARANEQNIELVNEHAFRSKFIVCTTAPRNVVERLNAAGVVPYWFAPLVDNGPESLTKQMTEISGCPAINTGGTVGTAAWVFAHSILRSGQIAVVGMDFGYAMDTPFEQTQSYNMLKQYENIAEFYPHFSGYWGEAYTDPTYWWYRENFLDLLNANKARVINCSGEGLLFGPHVGCMDLEQWLAFSS